MLNILNKIFNLHKKEVQFDPKFLVSDKKTILVIDDYLPWHDKSSGSKRLFELVKILKSIGLNVIFLPDDGLATEPYYDELIALEIDVLLSSSKKQEFEELKKILPLINYCWISRPMLNQKFQAFIRKHSTAKIIFDTVDLHFVRMLRQAEKENNPKLKGKALKIKKLELDLSKAADATLVVTDIEKGILGAENLHHINVIPNIHELKIPEVQKSFELREGIVFIGGYRHEPNVDAAKWLIAEIMPLVWNQIGNVKVYLLGSDPNEEILSLANEWVIVPGYLHNVETYFLNARLFVAPLRYGAGMKGKIGQSLEYSLPIVSTSIGAEGMGLIADKHVLLADNKIAFANQIIRLYQDINLWEELRSNSFEALKDYSPSTVANQLKRLLKNL